MTAASVGASDIGRFEVEHVLGDDDSLGAENPEIGAAAVSLARPAGFAAASAAPRPRGRPPRGAVLVISHQLEGKAVKRAMRAAPGIAGVIQDSYITIAQSSAGEGCGARASEGWSEGAGVRRSGRGPAGRSGPLAAAAAPARATRQPPTAARAEAAPRKRCATPFAAPACAAPSFPAGAVAQLPPAALAKATPENRGPPPRARPQPQRPRAPRRRSWPAPSPRPRASTGRAATSPASPRSRGLASAAEHT